MHNRVGLKVETNDFSMSIDQLDKTEIRPGKYFKGMNMFIDIGNTKLDPFSNPYYQLKVYISRDPST